MARALIVGCGCRGQSLARGLVDQGWVVRGTSRRPEEASAIEASGAEFSLADPARLDSLLDQVADVAVVIWLLGSATGEPAAVEELHGSLLEHFLARLVDTPVRGFVYEASGTAGTAALEQGAEIVAGAGERWRIPTELIRVPPEDRDAWLSAALAAASGVASLS
jgi:nucleoside-diphosphate-sugar epimerase